ncbi:hypothetical protein DFA_09155 [Cavenderia fasciculata]|uniref:Uncharacterized protein n=1 Tax=Cavenderia fasciculata TaxID=261658 RepID=F4Q6U8_CACFS|nr:uncharacterized protein DFA_09155 [Cavenderia fasciculata]EGG16130.1 hypothetical protein DFA_09155 [Cavenderia fasciculata]|eukprot:XP_004352583.1 hypothetical protein DFA_09155 [Cavenderia fasciculata]
MSILPTINKQFPFNNLRKLNLDGFICRDSNILQQFISTMEIPLVKLILPSHLRPQLPFLARHASNTLKQSLETIRLEESSQPLLLQQFPNIKHIIVGDMNESTKFIVSNHRFTKLTSHSYS